jgi:hypothetical protein
MSRRRFVRTASAAGLVLLAVGVATPASAANDFTVTIDPTSAKPGDSLHITGTAPAECADGSFTVTQAYTNGDSAAPGDQTVTTTPAAITGTTIDTTVTVPADAVRSDAAENDPVLPDTVTVSFADCGGAAKSSTPVAVTVLPLSTSQTITLNPASPKSGSQVTVTSTNCVGGVIDAFIEDVDGNDFEITGDVTGTTFTGVATLTGATASQDPGDAVAYVSCAQSQLASADAVFESRSAVDFSLGAAATTTPVTPAAPAPAAPAAPVVATPTFTG